MMEDPPIPQYPSGSNEVPMRDIALMHHWCTATSYGFGDDFPGASDPWRVDIPILAQHYPFLMRGILAMTALHISRLTSDPSVRMKYIQLAAYNQDLALPEYRTALGDVTEHSVAAVLAFSTFTSVYSFAAPKEPDSLFSASALEWIFLHRGVGEIPPHWQNWIDQGPLHAQMHRRRLPPIDPTFNAEDYRLLNLRNMFSILKPDEQGDMMHYESALYWLRQAFAHTFSLESKLSSKYAILFWVERIPSAYLELVSQKKPCAMVLFAHCCILFHRAANFWFLDGFAEHLLNEIITEVTPQYVPWMEWPIQTCGML